MRLLRWGNVLLVLSAFVASAARLGGSPSIVDVIMAAISGSLVVVLLAVSVIEEKRRPSTDYDSDQTMAYITRYVAPAFLVFGILMALAGASVILWQNPRTAQLVIYGISGVILATASAQWIARHRVRKEGKSD